MSSNAKHCPFLNRADARCGDAFSIDNLDHAFKYCFGRYIACPVYAELLIERKVRRSAAEQHGEPLGEQHPSAEHEEQDNDSSRVIQVTVHRGAVGSPTLRRPQHQQ
jgi:hypothetical protein